MTAFSKILFLMEPKDFSAIVKLSRSERNLETLKRDVFVIIKFTEHLSQGEKEFFYKQLTYNRLVTILHTKS